MLPHSIEAFRDVVASTRDAAGRDGLLSLIEAAFARASRASEQTAGQIAPAREQYEARLLEFVRKPVLRRDPEKGDPLDPFQAKACSRLADLRSEALANLVSGWTASAERSTRVAGAFQLGQLALDERLPALLALIEDDDPLVAVSALHGCGMAAYRRRASDHFRASVFESAAYLVRGAGRSFAAGVGLGYREAVDAMIQLNPDRSVALFGSAECFRLENPALGAIVRALQPDSLHLEGREPIKVEPALLWPLFEAVVTERTRSDSRFDCDMLAGDLLVLGAISEPRRAKKEAHALRHSLDDASGWLDEAIRRAQRLCAAVPEPHDALRWIEDNPGVLARQEESVLRAYELVDHVNNDGLTLYLLNCADRVGLAIEGLEALKQATAAGVVRRSWRLMASHGRSAGSSDLDEILEGLTEDEERQLHALELQLERRQDAILASVDRYLVRRRSRFKQISTRP